MQYVNYAAVGSVDVDSHQLPFSLLSIDYCPVDISCVSEITSLQ